MKTRCYPVGDLVWVWLLDRVLWSPDPSPRDPCAVVILAPLRGGHDRLVELQAQAVISSGRGYIRFDKGGCKSASGLPLDAQKALAAVPDKVQAELLIDVAYTIGFNPLTGNPMAVAHLRMFAESLANTEGGRIAAQEAAKDLEMAALVKRARVYQFDAVQILRLHHHAALAWEVSRGDKETPEIRPEIAEEIEALPWPDGNWPFEALFLGWSAPLEIAPGSLGWTERSLHDSRIGDVRAAASIGILAQRSGVLLELISLNRTPAGVTPNRKAPGETGVCPCVVYSPVRRVWAAPLLLWGAILPVLLAAASANPIAVQLPGTNGVPRRDKVRPKLGSNKTLRERIHEPPAYYPIHLENFQVRGPKPRPPAGIAAHNEEGERVRCVKSFTYRWDVSAHRRLYVRRGPLPLAYSERWNLEREGFKVHINTVPDRDLDRLLSRGHRPVAVGEWIALRSIRIEAHLAGPEGLPYKPAARICHRSIAD